MIFFKTTGDAVEVVRFKGTSARAIKWINLLLFFLGADKGDYASLVYLCEKTSYFHIHVFGVEVKCSHGLQEYVGVAGIKIYFEKVINQISTTTLLRMEVVYSEAYGVN